MHINGTRMESYTSDNVLDCGSVQVPEGPIALIFPYPMEGKYVVSVDSPYPPLKGAICQNLVEGYSLFLTDTYPDGKKIPLMGNASTRQNVYVHVYAPDTAVRRPATFGVVRGFPLYTLWFRLIPSHWKDQNPSVVYAMPREADCYYASAGLVSRIVMSLVSFLKISDVKPNGERKLRPDSYMGSPTMVNTVHETYMGKEGVATYVAFAGNVQGVILNYLE